MVIQNGKIFRENGKFETIDLFVEDGIIVDKTKQNEVIDASGLYVIPGLIDIHFHGCMGYDFCDASHEAISEMAKYQLRNGITAICPASMTLDVEHLKDIFRCAASYRDNDGAELVGIYMEGPFLSVGKKGAQAETYLRKADVTVFEKLQDEAGHMIKVLAIAPEEEGAMDFIKEMSQHVQISVAHTCADYSTAMKAFEYGAGQVTHLYNGMNGMNHREPGVIGAVSDNQDVMAELICDGLHIHPAVVRATFKMLGDDRIILVSDSMSACGLGDGIYDLGGQEIEVKEGIAKIAGTEVIAASVKNVMECMKTAVKHMHIPLESAIKACTQNPAKAIGVYDQMGSITIGKKANLVIMDECLNIRYVIKDGKLVHCQKEER